MLNKFIGIGNLTGDPETKSVGQDKKVCKFCIAINNRINDSVHLLMSKLGTSRQKTAVDSCLKEERF